MPIDDLNGGILSLFNTTTNKKLCDLDGIKEIQIEESSTGNGSPDEHKIIHTSVSSEMSITFNVNKPIDLNKVLGLDIAKFPDSYDVQYVKIIQARKHKKKRINKKWLKRYGYKKVMINSKGWKINTLTDGTVEFVK